MTTLYTYRATVAGVAYDADTIDFNIDLGLSTWRHNERVRLFGIDAFEVRRNSSKGIGDEHVAKGKEARDRVRELLPVGTEVILKTIKDEAGKYGRLLGVVWVPLENFKNVLGGVDDSSENYSLWKSATDLEGMTVVNLNDWLLATGRAVKTDEYGSHV